MSDAADARTPNDDLQLERGADGIAWLRLNRPERRNALDDAMVDALAGLLDAVDADDTCRVLILTGAGKGFCAGFDLSLVDRAPGEEAGETAAWTRRQERFSALVARLRTIRQPVIAAVNGAASGAGFALALGADVRLAARSARFNAAFVRIGLSACDMGLSWLLPRAIGSSRAFELMLTGRFVDGAEAERIGLVSDTVDDASLPDRARALAEAIAQNSAFGVWMTKRGMWANLENPSLSSAIELENRTQILARTTGDMQALVRARGFGRGEGR
jgi:enoyl-CoA hydratase